MRFTTSGRLSRVAKMDRRVLVVTTDAGVAEDGTYRPGGLQLFSRLVVRALAESTRLDRLGVLSLLDSQRAMDGTFSDLLATARSTGRGVRADGCSGNRMRVGLKNRRDRLGYDLAVFLQID